MHCQRPALTCPALSLSHHVRLNTMNFLAFLRQLGVVSVQQRQLLLRYMLLVYLVHFIPFNKLLCLVTIYYISRLLGYIAEEVSKVFESYWTNSRNRGDPMFNFCHYYGPGFGRLEVWLHHKGGHDNLYGKVIEQTKWNFYQF